MALPPGPDAVLPIAAYRWVKDPVPLLERSLRQFGDTFTLRFPRERPWRSVSVVVTAHPGTIREVFTGPGELLHAGKAAAVLGPLVGKNSLLCLDGRSHLRQRRLMLPPFHGERMRSYVAAMRDETLDEIRKLPSAAELTLHRHLQQITLRVILRTVFGMDEGKSKSELGAVLTSLLDVAADPTLLLANLLPFAFGNKKRFVRELGQADRMIYALIDERRRAGDTGERVDVLSMLLSARDEDGQPMTDTELRDELVTLLVAGHETTATSLAWTIRLLLENPEVMERADAEVQAAGDLDADSLTRLEWLDAVIKESLRLRPVIPMVGRVLQVPMTFRGYRLPAGAGIAPSVWLTHHNPAVYPDPHVFRPERFVGIKPNPYAWLPFGGGIRRCLGQAFALVEMKIVMATLLRHVEIRPVTTAPVHIVRRSITFAPGDQTRVIIRRRAALRAA